MLQWAVCSAILFSEMVICAFVVLPLPLKWRNGFLEKLSNFWYNYPRARTVIKTFISLVALFLIDALRSMYLVTTMEDPLNPVKPEELRLRMIAAQRNAFLTGFTLFMFFMLNRFEGMLFDTINLEKRVKKLGEDQQLHLKQFQKLREDFYLNEKQAHEHNLPDLDFLKEEAQTEVPQESPLISNVEEVVG